MATETVGRMDAFIAQKMDAAQLAALALTVYREMFTSCLSAEAAVRRGKRILNATPYVGGTLPAGFDAATRGQYASAQEVLEEADADKREVSFLAYAKLALVSLRVAQPETRAATSEAWLTELDTNTFVAAMDDLPQLDEFREALTAFVKGSPAGLRYSSGVACEHDGNASSADGVAVCATAVCARAVYCCA